MASKGSKTRVDSEAAKRTWKDGCDLDLTAGAGLVRGSIAERELQEVGLKLAVLADQLELQTSARNRSIV